LAGDPHGNKVHRLAVAPLWAHEAVKVPVLAEPGTVVMAVVVPLRAGCRIEHVRLRIVLPGDEPFGGQRAQQDRRARLGKHVLAIGHLLRRALLRLVAHQSTPAEQGLMSEAGAGSGAGAAGAAEPPLNWSARSS